MKADFSYMENEVKYERIIRPSNVAFDNKSILLKSLSELDQINDLLRIHDLKADLVMDVESNQQLYTKYFAVEVQVRPLSERGLLLFFNVFNPENRYTGFVSLALQGGIFEFRLSTAFLQTHVVRSNHYMSIGEWHTIKLIKFGKRISLWVSGVLIVGKNQN
jgi:EYS protein